MDEAINTVVKGLETLVRTEPTYEKYLGKFKLALFKLDRSTSRATHRGGMYATGPGISLAGVRIAQANNSLKSIGLVKFMEYASFCNDKTIGNAYCSNITQYFMLTTAHEMSHAAQLYIRSLDPKFKHDRLFGGHNEVFKSLYRHLRANYVNKQLPDQIEYAEKYASLLKSAVKVERSWEYAA